MVRSLILGLMFVGCTSPAVPAPPEPPRCQPVADGHGIRIFRCTTGSGLGPVCYVYSHAYSAEGGISCHF